MALFFCIKHYYFFYKMKIISIIATLFLSLSILSAQPKVIAHRGHYINVEGSTENSITSLRKAQELNIYGAEFDVWMTLDGVLIVNHDDVIQGIMIQDVPYEKIKDLRLENGEILPTLEAYLQQGKQDRTTRLILELKPHSTKEREDRAVAAVVKMVEEMGVKDQTEYISFSLNICKELRARSPQAHVAYLGGDIAPNALKAMNIPGISYSIGALRNNMHWIKEAQDLGMTVNVWTLYTEVDMREMINAGVDFITSGNSLLTIELLK